MVSVKRLGGIGLLHSTAKCHLMANDSVDNRHDVAFALAQTLTAGKLTVMSAVSGKEQHDRCGENQAPPEKGPS